MDPASGVPASTISTRRALQVAGEYQKRALDPVDRFSEVIFGLIMVLAFTCSLSVAQGSSTDVHQMLVAALGCNLAWGLVDAVMYIVTSIADRESRATLFRGIRAADPASGRGMVLAVLPEWIASAMDDAEPDRIAARIRESPEPKRRQFVTLEDLRGALWSCILVLLATLPPAIPFLLVKDPGHALRVSNGVAVASMFLAGYWLGRAIGRRPWLVGLTMVVIGSAMVALTIALGG
jgi:hypothetical protein